MDETYIIFVLAGIVVALMIVIINKGEALRRCREQLTQRQKRVLFRCGWDILSLKTAARRGDE